jgi:hypothetical protein
MVGIGRLRCFFQGGKRWDEMKMTFSSILRREILSCGGRRKSNEGAGEIENRAFPQEK